MRILVAHNSYLHRGGEDAVVDAEVALLRAHGHDVELYQRHNDELQTMSKPAAAVSTVWAQRTVVEMNRLCDSFQPDVVHSHNTLALISPSLYWVAARRRLPVVQTLHNFRLLCPQAMLLREGKVCEDCVGKLPWRAVTRKCYRESALQSAVLGSMLATHRALGTFREKVTRYIALNNFCRDKFIQGGLPAGLLCIKPHFVAAHHTPQWLSRHGGLFIGRLSPEKGLDVLIEAMRMIGALGTSADADIQIIGNGPLEDKVRQAFGADFLGFQQTEQVRKMLGVAQFLVAPSTCYETFGLVVIEAYSCGTPVIASRHGGLGELVKDGVTGLLFNPGDAADLARKIAWARAHPKEMLQMGRQAYAEYQARYTPEHNHSILMDIYEEAITVVEDARAGACHAT